jgi:hypothetical protein
MVHRRPCWRPTPFLAETRPANQAGACRMGHGCLVMADRPIAWADAQRAFHDTYRADPAGLPRCDVHWRSIERVPDPYGPGVLGLAGILRWATSRSARRQVRNRAPLLAVWKTGAPADAEASLVFEVSSSPNTSEGDGILVGDLAPNAGLCIETTAGEVLWPTCNPVDPVKGTPRR